MSKKKQEDSLNSSQSNSSEYRYGRLKFNADNERIDIWCVYKDKAAIAIISPGLESPEGVANGICSALNNQSKYILPVEKKKSGGGIVRKLTKKEIKRQAKLQREAWGLKE